MVDGMVDVRVQRRPGRPALEADIIGLVVQRRTLMSVQFSSFPTLMSNIGGQHYQSNFPTFILTPTSDVSVH